MADETHDIDPLARLAPHVRAVERGRTLLRRGSAMSDNVVPLLIEALVDQAGEARRAQIEAAHMRALAESRVVVDAECPPTIARTYLIAAEMRMRKAAQVLKRGRNAELSRDLLESANGVAKFLHDTRGKK